MNNDVKNTNPSQEVLIENEVELEIIELEDKVAPRNWEVYALLTNTPN